jgi:hypothetical protein
MGHTWRPASLLGAYTPCAKRRPVKPPQMTSVAIQEPNCLATNTQLTPLTPSHAPMPMIAPVMHWEDEVGRPYLRHHKIISPSCVSHMPWCRGESGRRTKHRWADNQPGRSGLLPN